MDEFVIVFFLKMYAPDIMMPSYLLSLVAPLSNYRSDTNFNHPFSVFVVVELFI